MLAKNSQTPRVPRKHALSLTFFASKLAPTIRPCAIVKSFSWLAGKSPVCSYTPKSHHRFSIILKYPPCTSTNRHIMEALRGLSKKTDKKPNH
ncbi:hypothetical protein MF6394_31130 [Pseudomonas sp. MF6394]|nr:hypothetical protein MF6394_31130 [Pseudomonas sp. MF6394]